ncbi:hypothetical protein [Hymenobacter rubidus]|uniref:hypothetical protein n=1 Tax=Hymenobacter rubidus TaxID=1441626 RepID=UPI00191ED9D8|nr:hypothetical protein [Hymenobacter rubidus]
MAYHKRPAQARACAHCGAVFSAAHKSRRYCSSSCNTLAWRARRALAGPLAPAPRAVPEAPPAAEAGPQALDFSFRNVGVIAVGTAVGQLAVQAGTYAVRALARPAPDAWVPAELRGSTGLRQWVQLPGWPAAQLAVQGVYRGHVFHYCAAAGVLFGETTAGAWLPIASRAQLDHLLPPERVRPLVPAYPSPTPPALPAAGTYDNSK